MEIQPSLQALDLDALVGRPVDEARAAVTAAGGRLRAVGPGEMLTMDYRTDRVTLLVEDGVVVESRGIG